MKILEYLGEVSVCMLAAYFFYYMLLSKTTFFVLNRAFLLAALPVSLYIPLHSFEKTVLVSSSFSNLQAETPERFISDQYISTNEVVNTPIYWTGVLLLIYWGGALFMIFKFISSLRHIYNLKRRGEKLIHNNRSLKVYNTPESRSNCSFFNLIFIKTEGLDPSEVARVIEHESLHSRLYHSLDIMLAELAKVLLWFNPVIYFYKRSLSKIHEFQVDELMVRSCDKQSYALLLLKLVTPDNHLISNSFNTPPIKERIETLFKNRTRASGKLVYLSLFPLITLGLLSFGKENTKFIYADNPEKTKAGMGSSLRTISPTNNPGKKPLVHIDKKDFAKFIYIKDPGKTKANPDDSLRTIHGTNNLGKNPLVFINKKEYPSGILYAIDPKKVRGSRIAPPNNNAALKKYGEKAKDGYVELHTLNSSDDFLFTNTSAYQIHQENIPVILKSDSKNAHYDRITLKNDSGEEYDMVILRNPKGGAAGIEVPKGKPVAFFINNIAFTEDEIKNMDSEVFTTSGTRGGAEHPDYIVRLFGEKYRTFSGVLWCNIPDFKPPRK